MSAPEGGFCAAEDADSEGEEGRFYVWTEQEIRDALPRSEADLVIRAFGVSAAGNFRDEATGRNTGKNILHLKADGGIPILEEPDAKARLEKARTALFSIREGRIHPLRDDKVLTDWNGLMIAALARGPGPLKNHVMPKPPAGQRRFWSSAFPERAVDCCTVSGTAMQALADTWTIIRS